MIQGTKKRFVHLICVIALILAGCQKNKNLVEISGQLSHSEGFTLRLSEMDPREIIPVDSVSLDSKGRFQLEFPVADPGFYTLEAADGKIVVLIIHPGDKIAVSGNAEHFPDDIQIEGPPEAIELHKFFTETRLLEKSIDSLEQVLMSRQDDDNYFEVTSQADTLLRKIWEEQRAREISYIEKNASKLSSLVVINYAFSVTPTLGMEEDFHYYALLDSTLSAAFPENKHVQFHKQRMVNFIPPQP